MGCGIGMATDVAARVSQLKDEGKVPQWAAWHAVESGLTREEANAMEKALRPSAGRIAKVSRKAVSRAVGPGACIASTGSA